MMRRDSRGLAPWTAGIGAAALALLAMATTPPETARPPAASAKVPAAKSPRDSIELRTYVRTLAAPAWEGRGIGTAGIDSAADWIAKRLQAAGLQPAGDSGGWFQPFEVTTGVVAETPCELQVGKK